MRYIRKSKHFGAIIKSKKDVGIFVNSVPIIMTSNKTGQGYDKLIELLELIEKRPTKIISHAFVVDSVYTVPGFGTVICGITGIEINKNEELLIGPFDGVKKQFIKVKVRTIHDDYRNFVDKLNSGQRGCLCIKVDQKYKRLLSSGLVAVKSPEDVNPVNRFIAKIHVFQGTSNTIKPGYNTFINTGTIKSSARFVKIMKTENEEVSCTRGGEVNIVEAEFLKKYYCINKGERFIFREGGTIGYGIFL
jgi:GTPase